MHDLQIKSDEISFVEMAEIDSFDCNKCGKKLSSRQILRRHMKDVHNQQTFACKFCEKRFNRKDGAQRHIQEIHEYSSLVCDYCGDNFMKRVHVKKHVFEFHPDKAVQDFKKCDKCDKVFTLKIRSKERESKYIKAHFDKCHNEKKTEVEKRTCTKCF